jgi:hypothetical protein
MAARSMGVLDRSLPPPIASQLRLFILTQRKVGCRILELAPVHLANTPHRILLLLLAAAAALLQAVMVLAAGAAVADFYRGQRR